LTWLQMESYFIKKVNYETADNFFILFALDYYNGNMRLVRRE